MDGKDNSEMYFREMDWEGVDWAHLVQNQDKNILVFILLSEQHKFVEFVK